MTEIKKKKTKKTTARWFCQVMRVPLMTLNLDSTSDSNGGVITG